MKKIIKKCKFELIFLALQLLVVYLYPFFADPADPIRTVLIMLLAVVALAFLMGCFARTKIKLLFPFAVAVLFIPSVWVHPNVSAIFHAIWYLIGSSMGVSVGAFIHALIPHNKYYDSDED